MQTHAPCSAWAAISDDAYDTVNSESKSGTMPVDHALRIPNSV